MVDYFDDLMKMWDKTTDEHIEWLKKSKTSSAWDLFQNILDVTSKIDGFEEKTKHMRDENAGNQGTLLAAKFKNQWAANRYLVSVLMEFTTRLIEMLVDKSAKPSEIKEESGKIVLNDEMKREIARQIKIAIARYKKENSEKVVVRDSKRKKKSL